MRSQKSDKRFTTTTALLIYKKTLVGLAQIKQHLQQDNRYHIIKLELDKMKNIMSIDYQIKITLDRRYESHHRHQRTIGNVKQGCVTESANMS